MSTLHRCGEFSRALLSPKFRKSARFLKEANLSEFVINKSSIDVNKYSAHVLHKLKF